MIYKIDEGSTYSAKQAYYVYTKPFNLWPFWKHVITEYSKGDLLEKLRVEHLNPIYEGSLKQIISQISKVPREDQEATKNQEI
jgi:hypothetical protein